MQISSLSTSTLTATPTTDRFTRTRQAFEDLGSALESGDLSEAKSVLTEIQKNAPKQSGSGTNPVGEKVDALSEAIDSGDVEAAQDAYADLKKTLSQRPSGRPSGPPPGGGAPPSGGGGKASGGSGTSGTSSSSKTYDKMDANQDGTVSWKEKQDYLAQHPEAVEESSSSNKIDSARGTIDALA